MPMSTQPLLESTYRLLDKTDLKAREIATGAGVDLNWLYKLQQRAIGEPGVMKVQAVYDFLRSKKRARERDHAS